MRTLKITLLLIAYALAFTVLGCVVALAVADNLAYKNAIDDEYLDLYELAIKEDYNCRIKSIDTHNIGKGEVTYLCVSEKDETNSFFVVLELKQIAPFRYEWVERYE